MAALMMSLFGLIFILNVWWFWSQQKPKINRKRLKTFRKVIDGVFERHVQSVSVLVYFTGEENTAAIWIIRILIKNKIS